MTNGLKIALAQHDSLVGDLHGNAEKILDWIEKARDELGADVVLFPELNLTGYPPEDLLLRKGFINDSVEQLEILASRVSGITAIVGCPLPGKDGLCNSAIVIQDGKQVARYDKQVLPNYSVFDEKRYFVSGIVPCVIDIDGVRLGITICEDVWTRGPVTRAVGAGAEVILNLNASPYHMDKSGERFEVVSRQAKSNGVPIVYVNAVGGQDELVFDGGSFVVNDKGSRVLHARQFEEDLPCIEFARKGGIVQPLPATLVADLDRTEGIYRALVTGVRDYVIKNRFQGAVIGLSGGIDSALTLAVAVDALGAENVEVVLMPSRYTKSMSIEDAVQQAENLSVHHQVIEIEPMFEAFLESLKNVFDDAPVDTTEENIQARCRGIILMAISNKQGRIVLTTGNKSEMAVGYATLYGDMAGGFAVIKDVPKMLVYELANWRNRNDIVIPQRVIDRPPSAELAADQQDTDSLPPYEVLDKILDLYIEQQLSYEEIIAAGYDADVVRRVIRMVDLNEYKRQQAAPGVRITQLAFGRDRRYPITSGYLRQKFDNSES